MDPFIFQRHRMMDYDTKLCQTYSFDEKCMPDYTVAPNYSGSLIHTTQDSNSDFNDNENYDIDFLTRERTREVALPSGNTSTMPNTTMQPGSSSTPGTNVRTGSNMMNGTIAPRPSSTQGSTTMTGPTMVPPSPMPRPSTMPPPSTGPTMMPQTTMPRPGMMTPPSSGPNMMPQPSMPRPRMMASPTTSGPNMMPQPSIPRPRMMTSPTTETRMPSLNNQPYMEDNLSDMNNMRNVTPPSTMPRSRQESQTITSTPPSPLRNFMSLEECELAYDKDLEYIKQMYSSILKVLLAEIQKEFDLVDYEDSFIFDEYPDKDTLLRMADVILERAENMDLEQGDLETTQFRSGDKRRRNPFLRHLVENLVFQELLHRRRHKRRRKDRRRFRH